jgi:threonine synthase
MAHRVWNELIDPHTADGMKVALELREKEVTMVVLETALPIKFSETIQEALNHLPPVPERLKNILTLPKQFTVMPIDVEMIKQFIVKHSNFPTTQ